MRFLESALGRHVMQKVQLVKAVARAGPVDRGWQVR